MKGCDSFSLLLEKRNRDLNSVLRFPPIRFPVKEAELQTSRGWVKHGLRARSLGVINDERHTCEARCTQTRVPSLTTMPVEGLRSSSMMKRYLRAKKVARVEGISMQGYVVGEKSGCHPLGKMLSKSNSFSELNCKWRDSFQFYATDFRGTIVSSSSWF